MWRNSSYCCRESLRTIVMKERQSLESAIAKLNKHEVTILCHDLGVASNKMRKHALSEAFFNPDLSAPVPSALAFCRLVLSNHHNSHAATHKEGQHNSALMPAVLLESLYMQHMVTKAAGREQRGRLLSIRTPGLEHMASGTGKHSLHAGDCFRYKSDAGETREASPSVFQLNPASLPTTWGLFQPSNSKSKRLQSVGF